MPIFAEQITRTTVYTRLDSCNCYARLPQANPGGVCNLRIQLHNKSISELNRSRIKLRILDTKSTLIVEYADVLLFTSTDLSFQHGFIVFLQS